MLVHSTPNSLEHTQEYIWFKSTIKLRTVVFNIVKKDEKLYTPQIWEYYIYNQRPGEAGVVVVMFPSMLEKGDSFFYVFRHFYENRKKTKTPVTVVAIDDFPPHYTHEDFLLSFHKFMCFLFKKKEWEIHLFGCEYSGFLMQLFCQTYPKHVKSLILCNTYCDSSHFQKEYSYVDYYSWVPSVILRRFLTGLFPTKTPDEWNRLAIDFVLKRFGGIPTKALSSRYKLKGIFAKIFQISIRVEDITVMETCDEDWLVDSTLKENLYKFYPNARRGYMKRGGEFPYLSSHEDFVLFMEVHLNRYTANELFVVAELECKKFDHQRKKDIYGSEEEEEGKEEEEEEENEGEEEEDDDDNEEGIKIEDDFIEEEEEEEEDDGDEQETIFEGKRKEEEEEEEEDYGEDSKYYGSVLNKRIDEIQYDEDSKSNDTSFSSSDNNNASPSGSYHSDGNLQYFDQSQDYEYGAL